MTLTQLEYALAVARAGGFSKAAQACAVTQPSLSAQVQHLEAELGVVLFDRSKNPVKPTAVGRRLLAQARRVLDEARRMSDLSMEWKGELKGELRLGVIPTLAPYLVPLFLKAFVKAHPQVKVVLEEDKTQELVRALEEGDLDLALLSPPGRASGELMEKPLFFEPFVVYAHPGHPLLAQKAVAYRDLPMEELLLLDDTHCLRDQVVQACGQRPKASPGAWAEIKSGGLQTLIGLVNQGKGFTLLPYLAALDLDPARRKRQARPFLKPVPARKVSLAYHRSQLKRPFLEALHASILDCLPPGVFPSLKAGLKALPPADRHFLI